MQAHRYFAKDSPDEFERERLELLTDYFDPVTIRRLNVIGILPGWNCLEVGAGSGSVARWIAGRVGPEGRVVATDLNPRFLGGHELPNLEVRRHNIVEDELESAQYDLVHCRLVLAHLPDPPHGLRRLFEAVRPGGWLLVEEIDVGQVGASDPAHPRTAEFNRRMRSMWMALKEGGTVDPTFGRKLPILFDRLAVDDLAYDGVTAIARGGDLIARFARMTNELLKAPIIAAGVLHEADFAEMATDLDDRSFWLHPFTNFAAWGRRPG
jgi:2-polyprenyl-3-methyl-5-hydroxy-6-metoxy-1,4-benzoquinol methylase